MKALRAAGAFALVLGSLTIFSGGRTLLVPAARTAAEPVVPFVLVFNTAAGFVYLAAGVGLWLGKRWAPWLASLIAGSTLLVFGAFAVHVFAGGAYAVRTVAALTFRSSVWCVLAVIAHRMRNAAPC